MKLETKPRGGSFLERMPSEEMTEVSVRNGFSANTADSELLTNEESLFTTLQRAEKSISRQEGADKDWVNNQIYLP
jgi:hypothetical protein